MHIALPCLKIVDLLSFHHCWGSNPWPYHWLQNSNKWPGNLADFCRNWTVSFPPQSDLPFRRKMQKSQLTCHVPLTHVKGMPPSKSPMDRILTCWLLAHQVWVKSIHWFGLQVDTHHLQLFARLHVAPAACNRSVCNQHHLLSAAPAHQTNIRPSRLDQPFGLQRWKCLDTQTHTHTNIGRPTLFQRPTRGNSSSKAFNADALKPFYSMISWIPILIR